MGSEPPEPTTSEWDETHEADCGGGDRLRGAHDGRVLRRAGQRRRLRGYRRRQDRGAAARRGAVLRARPGRDGGAQRGGAAPLLHHGLRRGHPRGRDRLHRGGHADRGGRARRPALRAHRGPNDRRAAVRAHHHREQEHRAHRDGGLGGHHPAAHGAARRELCRGLPPRGPGAGLGYGGSCFPKDVRALAQMAAYAGCHPQLLRAVMEINRDQRVAVAAKVREGLGGALRGARIALLGLAFKPNTDDMREAPSVELAEQFLAGGASVAGYDPQATAAARAVLGERIGYHASAYAAVDGADAVVLVTEWPEFRALDLGRVKTLMRGAVFVDGRNLYEPEALRALGFHYYGVGRGYAAQPFPADADDLYQDANGGG